MTSRKSKEPCTEGVEAFVRGMTSEVNAADVSCMMALQQHMMSRFEKTNEMLLNFNRLSDARYEQTQKDFKKHIHLLHDMRKDLDNIFRRIRVLKHRLNAQYPQAFQVCEEVHLVPDEDVIEEESAAETEPVESSSEVASVLTEHVDDCAVTAEDNAVVAASCAASQQDST